MIFTLMMMGILRSSLDHRYDGNPNLPYYSPEELGLNEERFSFYDEGYLIDGSRYFTEGVKPKALVCVFHGIGAGRNAYMKEISRICKEGYLVYAYDNLGCMRSEGRGIKSLGRVFETQKKFFEWLENDEKAKGLRRFSFGHSWGGYSSMLSLNPKYRIEKAVALAGLLSPSSAILYRLKSPIKKILLPSLTLANRILGGKNCNVDARSVLTPESGKLLYISGSKDPIVNVFENEKRLDDNFCHSDSFSSMVIENSGHSVSYSLKSQDYISDLMSKGLVKINSPEGLHMDIDKATELNEDVMRATFDFFAN